MKSILGNFKFSFRSSQSLGFEDVLGKPFHHHRAQRCSVSTSDPGLSLQCERPFSTAAPRPCFLALALPHLEDERCSEVHGGSGPRPPAAVGFSAADHTRSSESKIRNREKETNGYSFKESASSDPWERTSQTIPQVTGVYLNRNQTQFHSPSCWPAEMLHSVLRYGETQTYQDATV